VLLALSFIVRAYVFMLVFGAPVALLSCFFLGAAAVHNYSLKRTAADGFALY
jgi:hypothetical protein